MWRISTALAVEPCDALDVVHGGGSGSDWTLGCIALDDADLDALRALLPADRRSWIYVRP